MNKVLFLAALIAMISWSGCKDNEEPQKPKLEMLTGSSSKTWNISSQSIDDDQNTKSVCKSTSARSMDNRWEFFSNGNFEFDNGTVVGDASCQETGCCSDMINLYGTWAFQTNDTYLVITARGSLENGVRIPLNPEQIMNARIMKFTDTQLILEQSDSVYTFVPLD